MKNMVRRRVWRNLSGLSWALHLLQMQRLRSGESWERYWRFLELFVIIWSHGMEGKRGKKEPGRNQVQVRVLMGFGHSPLATYEIC